MSPDDSTPSLRPLFDRLRDGDPHALNDIFAHCEERLKTHVRRMLRGFPGVRRHGDTDDVYQEVCTSLIRSLRTVPVASPTDFLVLAACQIRRTLIDLTRRKKPGHLPAAGGRDGDPDPADDPADDSNDPADLAVWQEIHTRIGALPDDERVLFDLLYYQELSRPDAADLLGISVATLKRRWQAARIGLMAEFEHVLPFS